MVVVGDPNADIELMDFFLAVPPPPPPPLLLNATDIGASSDFFSRILMPIVFSLSWLWYIATNALRFGRPLVVVFAVVDADADVAVGAADRATDFLLDSIAIANDFGFPPDGDFLTTELGDIDDTSTCR